MSIPARSWSRMASWVASSNVSLTSVWPYSPALILSRAVQNQPGKAGVPIAWGGIGGSAPVTRRFLSEGPAVGNGRATGATRYDRNTHYARAFLGHSWLHRPPPAGGAPRLRDTR